MAVTDIPVLILVTVSGYWDLRFRKIPNWLTLPGIVLGLVMNALLRGGSGIRDSGLGLLIGFGALFALFILNWMGGGDVKLMAAIGALKGHPFVISALWYSLLAGIVLGLMMLILNHRTRQTLKRLFLVIASRLSPLIPRQELIAAQNQPVPFGFAIALGTIWAIIAGNPGMPGLLAGI